MSCFEIQPRQQIFEDFSGTFFFYSIVQKIHLKSELRSG